MPAARPVTALHYVGYNDDRGGIVSVVRALATADRFRCVLGVNHDFRQRRSPPLPTFEFEPIAGEELGPATFWRARSVATHVKRWLEADASRVFHGHSRAGLAVALWLGQRGESRMVVSVHCYGRQRWFYRWAAHRLGERLFWLSPAMKRHYGIPPGTQPWARCIPGCIVFDEIAPRRERPGDRIRLGGIGAVVPWKRWHLVLDALAALPVGRRDQLEFVHIGGTGDSPDGERYAAMLRARTAALGLESIVTWRGEESSSGPLLREIDCLLVTSDREPLSIAMLEALAAGVPVLAADSGGAVDAITPSVNGWLFRSGDAADLAQTLARLVASDDLASVRSKRVTLERFSAPVVAAQWAEVYARVLAGADTLTQ